MFLLLTGSRGTACAKFVVLIVSVVALKSSWTSVQFLTRASKNKSGTLPQMSALGLGCVKTQALAADVETF